MEIKDNLRITIAQVDLAWENPGQNRRDLELQIRQLAGKSDLVILPETFTTGFSMHASDLAEPMDGPTIKWLINLSQITSLAIGGSIIIKDNGLYYNRFVFITPNGENFFYDKRHLFSIGGESISFTAGNQRLIVNFLGWRIALYICYDLRFPVWCRNVNDTDLMIFTANWPASRSEVWKTLLKARAIENQVYVTGVNRIGTDGNGISYIGESQFVNYRGEVLTENNISTSGLLSYEISKKELNNFREIFPVANDADRFLII
ncbi:MAG: amidohydrolase [Bacteroidia bacterium]|nr:amidohydrolase [Bacteroidia bacterium]